MDKDISYSDRRNPNLPWGYWLVADETEAGVTSLTDEDGRHWSSVREAFWTGRLNMLPLRTEVRDESLEMLGSFLAVLDRRIIGIEEQVNDLCHSNWWMTIILMTWLQSMGLIEAEGLGAYSSRDPLTPEGKAVLIMLASTRPAAHTPYPLGMSWITARQGLDRGYDREVVSELIRRQEQYADGLNYRFTRTEIAGKPSIKLVGPDIQQTIPCRRTVWSMTFTDNYARDRFYLWLHERIDRWEAWGELASFKTAPALTTRLLELRFCDEEIGSS